MNTSNPTPSTGCQVQQGRKKRLVRRTAVVLLAVLAAGLGSALPGAATSPPDPGPAQLGDETAGELDDVMDVDSVLLAMQAHLGARSGMAWIDSSGARPMLRVGVLNPTSGDAHRLAQLAGPAMGRAKLVPVGRSAAELAALKERTLAVLRPAAVSYSVSVDPERQVVLVRVKRLDPALRRAVRDVVPANALDLAVDPGLRLELTHRRVDDYPPYEGGLQVKLGGGVCTSSFTVTLPNGPHGTTAGHCADIGQRVRIGNDVVGTVTADTVPAGATRASSDALAYRIGVQEATGRIYLGPGRHRRVTGQLSNAGLLRNTRVCFRGVTTGRVRCDRINGVDVTLTDVDTGVQIDHLWCVRSNPARPGDSGSPVYQPRGGAGAAHAAGVLLGNVLRDGRDGMCFSSIENVLGALGGQLVTAG